MQTGQYSIQIFSLAVLLSSLFVYNQLGGIDEAALDRLSLVTGVCVCVWGGWGAVKARRALGGTLLLGQAIGLVGPPFYPTQTHSNSLPQTHIIPPRSLQR
jgi:hypothetical protein